MKNIKVYEDFDTSYDGWETTYSSKFERHGSDEQNYMFFQHLMTIKDAIDELLEMDKQKIDMILTDGHAWAVDHITSSVDDIEEVYHFLKNSINDMDHSADSEMQVSPMDFEILSKDKVEMEELEDNEEE